jgi:glycosyltransferase involved in cell wall biosynthesis
MKLLASDKCKKIIAISRYAFDFQNHYLPSRSDWKGAIAGKMCILHPAQDILVRDYSEKQLDTEFITFTFAGHDFFRKGGKEILLVIDRLVNEHYPVKLNIVSRLGYGDYASMSTEQDRQRAEALIDKLRNHVTYYAVLPNSEVLNLFRRSHVSLLATYDDTYGFVVLESQAAGCPVISTDVCALPEINDNAVGWLIELPKDGDRIALMHTAEERSRLSSIIQERLYSIIKEICLKPHMIREKGIRSIEKTKRDYSPTQRADVLERIYGEALGSAS